MSALPLQHRMHHTAAAATAIQGAAGHFERIPNGRPNTIDEFLSIIVLAAQDAPDTDADIHIVGAKVQLARLGFGGHQLPLSHSDRLALYLLWLFRSGLTGAQPPKPSSGQKETQSAEGGRSTATDDPSAAKGDSEQGKGALYTEAIRTLRTTLTELSSEPRYATSDMWARTSKLWNGVLELRAGHEVERRVLEKTLLPLLPEGLKLAEHQLEMVRCIRAANYRYLLTDDMGLGKTIELIAALMLLGDDAFPIVIASPLSVTHNWQREIEKWMAKFQPVVRQMRPHTCGKDGDKSCQVCRLFDRDVPAYQEAGRNLVLIGSWQQMISHHLALMALRPHTVAGDEFHYIANHGSQRAQAFLRVRGRAKYVLGATGTLEPNGRHREAYCQIKAVAPNAFTHLVRGNKRGPDGLPRGDWKAFARRYCGPVSKQLGERSVTSYDGRSNDVEFGWVLARHTLRRTKPEVFGDDGMPPKTRYRIPVRISNRDRLKIAGMRDEVKAKLLVRARELETKLEAEHLPQATIKERVRRVLSSQAMTELSAMRLLIGHLKISWTMDRIKELLKGGHEVIVFCDHNAVADSVHERASKAFGAEAVLRGRGSMNGKQRGELVERAQTDDEVRLIVLTRAFREGITLTKFDRMIMVQRWWVPGDEAQAEDRPHRIGQERDVGIDYPVIEGSCDDGMGKLAVWKETGQQQVQGAAQVRIYEWIMSSSSEEEVRE